MIDISLHHYRWMRYTQCQRWGLWWEVHCTGQCVNCTYCMSFRSFLFLFSPDSLSLVLCDYVVVFVVREIISWWGPRTLASSTSWPSRASKGIAQLAGYSGPAKQPHLLWATLTGHFYARSGPYCSCQALTFSLYIASIESVCVHCPCVFHLKGMVMVSPEMDPTICWMFEAEIVLLFHAKTFHKGFQVTVHIGNVRQTATVEAMYGKVSSSTELWLLPCFFPLLLTPWIVTLWYVTLRRLQQTILTFNLL